MSPEKIKILGRKAGDNSKEKPIVGPRNHKHESKLLPEDVRLADGTLLYHIFIENRDPLSLPAAESQRAKARLSQIIETDREKVLSCQGKTREEAEAILKGVKPEDFDKKSEGSRKIKIEIAGEEEPSDKKGGVTLDTSLKPKAESSGVIVDPYKRPYGEDNVPAPAREKKFEPVPTVKAEAKAKKESGVDHAKIKELEKKIHNLNEKYLSAVQREDKALLYSQLEQAQKEYNRMQEEFEKNRHQSERERKVARLEALRIIIRDLNERYLRETQREQKAILYSQLEAAQKEYRKLEEELDRGQAEVQKKEETKSEEKQEDKKNEQAPEEKKKVEALKTEVTILFSRVLNGDVGAISVLLVLLRSQTEAQIHQIIGIEMGLQTQLLILLERAQGGDPAAVNSLVIFITTHHSILHVSIDNTPPPAPASALPLDDLRDMYLNAKRKRGNVARGWMGRIFGRTLNFRGTQMDFGGQQGAADLERVRNEYQEGLTRYRTAELRTLEANLSARLAAGTITQAQANAERTLRIVTLINEEDRNIDRRSTQGIERNFWEKVKTGFRRKVWTRIGTGFGLAGIASLTGGTAIATGAIVGGAALGAAGTYVGVEAGLERWSRLIGHKGGLILEMRRELERITRGLTPGAAQHAADTYIDSIPANQIREEAARLRMLQVEKGVSIDRLRTSGDSGAMAAMILQRDNELTAQEAMNTAHLANPTLGFAGMLSSRLAREINLRNELVENEVDRERHKKMLRKTAAALTGASIGLFTLGKLFPAPDATPPLPSSPVTPFAPYPPAPGSVPPGMFTVFRDLWHTIEAAPSVDHATAGLAPGAKTYFIDALKDIYEKMQLTDPAELVARGFDNGVDNLNPGDMLDLHEISDPGILARTLSNAQGLSPTDIATIMSNDSTIATWLADPANRATLTGAVNSQVIGEILSGAR